MAEVYIHEIAQVKPGKLAALRDAVRDEFLPLAHEHGLKSAGFFETTPTQGSWPETIEIWELPDFHAYLRFLDATRKIPALKAWQERKGELIKRSYSELCLRGPLTKTADEARAEFSEHRIWGHEMVEVPPSRQQDYVRMAEQYLRRFIIEPAGRPVHGHYISGFNNRLVINLNPFGEDIPTSDMGKFWPGDTEYEQGHQRNQSLWMMLGRQVRLGWVGRFLMPIRLH